MRAIQILAFRGKGMVIRFAMRFAGLLLLSGVVLATIGAKAQPDEPKVATTTTTVAVDSAPR
jgi:hypothetical protein